MEGWYGFGLILNVEKVVAVFCWVELGGFICLGLDTCGIGVGCVGLYWVLVEVMYGD